MDKSRKLIQFLSTFIGNANIKGLLNGTIYQGKLKSICFPGLNCYSCPAALGACPLGSLQAVLGFSPFMVSVYVIGFLTLIGALIGRFVCGFICPFGLFQELLHLLPSPKANISSRFFKLKYVFLIVFVIFIPVYTFIINGYAVTAFCKYICPQGTISAGLPLLLTNSRLRDAAGSLFLLKILIAFITILLSVVIFRPFCKLVCPLGAIYGFFNKYSIIKLSQNNNKCINCGKCKKACKISPDISVASAECIRCLECLKQCKTGAIYLSYDGLKHKKVCKKI